MTFASTVTGCFERHRCGLDQTTARSVSPQRWQPIDPDLARYQGRELTVNAWLWAHTVKSPSPAFIHIDVPLVSTFTLSSKDGSEAFVEPVVHSGGYRFVVKVGKPRDAEATNAGTKLGRGSAFRCLMSGTAIPGDYLKSEAKAGRMGSRLLAIVAQELMRGGCTYRRQPNTRRRPNLSLPTGRQNLAISGTTQYLGVKNRYGVGNFSGLFSSRQRLLHSTLFRTS